MNGPCILSKVGLGLLCIAAVSCFHGGYRQCQPPKMETIEREPSSLSHTGFGAGGQKAYAYRPRFELWADGADKRRWLSVPPGTRIDNSEQEQWRFPVGTKFWKEFSQEGRKLETRLLHKTGPSPSDWTALAYLWDAEGKDANAAPMGASNVLGTQHDVPSSAECMGCHGGRNDRVLGFSAVQLGFVADMPGQVQCAPKSTGSGNNENFPAPSHSRAPCTTS